jgi:hypothetical protein
MVIARAQTGSGSAHVPFACDIALLETAGYFTEIEQAAKREFAFEPLCMTCIAALQGSGLYVSRMLEAAHTMPFLLWTASRIGSGESWRSWPV